MALVTRGLEKAASNGGANPQPMRLYNHLPRVLPVVPSPGTFHDRGAVRGHRLDYDIRPIGHYHRGRKVLAWASKQLFRKFGRENGPALFRSRRFRIRRDPLDIPCARVGGIHPWCQAKAFIQVAPIIETFLVTGIHFPAVRY